MSETFNIPLAVDGDESLPLAVDGGEALQMEVETAFRGGGGGGAVNSVNGKTGNVVLDAADVGALPDTTTAADLGAYVKPSGGIPASDLASAVQTSLGKADSALQTAPVTSVNGNTGAVVLSIPSTAADVGAIAAPSSPATGAFLVWNGSAWVAQTLATWSGGSY